MPFEYQVDDQQMEMTKKMMEGMWGIQFLSESEDKDDPPAGDIIATYTDPKRKKWVARCSDATLNPAQIDLAQQILKWMAARR